MKTDSAYVADPRQVGPDALRGQDLGDDRRAHQRQAEALRRPARAQRAADGGRQRRSILKLGIGGLGTVGENHHVAPIHPEYAELPKKARDIAGAKKLMTDAGQIDFEHNLITVDEEWYKNTGDAIAAQLREAGFKVKRTVLPGSTFWNDWTKYPYSMTDWNMRPLGVQVLALAYRTGEAWNETAYSNPEFDAKLEKALAIPDPEGPQGRDEGPRADPAGFRHHHPALLADLYNH